jgi:hypothetical protein
MNTPIPEVVQRLAQTVEPLGKMPVVPIDWRVSDDVVVIVFEDGRKLRFEQEAEGGMQNAEGGGQINLADGVSEAEAEVAGRALAMLKAEMQKAESGRQKVEGGGQKAAREKKK